MRSKLPLPCLGLLVSLVVAAGCAGGPRHNVIATGPDGLRTFTVIREIDGLPVVCPAFGLVSPVTGTFEGQAGAREPVWIRSEVGQPLSVVWPGGFTVRFEPTAVLYNEDGKPVARAGERTELSQVRRDEHAGTYEDPYVASGILFDGCYPFVP